MTQYKFLNATLSYLQLNKLKFGMKYGPEVAIKLSSNVVGDSKDEYNFLHEILLTNTQVSKLCIAFVNNSSVNTKLSKTQFH